MIVHSDLRLARRLEFAEAKLAAATALALDRLAPGNASATLAISGGLAVFVGQGSPLTHAIGLGLEGPVAGSDLDLLEEFYRSLGSHVSIDVCPLADPSLPDQLGRRGYRPVEINNVLVRPLRSGEFFPSRAGIEVRETKPAEAGLWANLMMRGFLDRGEINTDEAAVGRIIFESSVTFLAALQGEPAGAGAMTGAGRLACLFADSTLAQARGKGVHMALIAARLSRAAVWECDLATAATLPGSGSQRNYERCGFQLAYSKAIFVREWPAA